VLSVQTKMTKISVAYTVIVFLKFAPCWLQWGMF